MEEINPIITPENQNSESREFAVAANLAPQTDTEKKGIDLLSALVAAEGKFRPGIEFGEGMIALRCEIKATKGRNWMLRLEQLGIPYAKVRYWIAVAEGKSIQRGKAKDNAQENPASEWDAAMHRLLALRDDVAILLRKSESDGGGILVDPLTSLADILGYQIVPIGGNNV
jgi:hypothetical protein